MRSGMFAAFVATCLMAAAIAPTTVAMPMDIEATKCAFPNGTDKDIHTFNCDGSKFLGNTRSSCRSNRK